MRLLSKLRSLSLLDYYVLLWATVMLPVTGLRLRSRGFKKVYSWANGRSNHHSAAIADAAGRSAHLGKMINFVALNGLYRANCLCRSLVLLRVMQREGLPGELKIGVPKDRNARSLSILDAHAWVESQGTVINDHVDVAQTHAGFDFN
jgi:hypothetical protein